MQPSMLDILWILMASALVFIMQAGFMCLESGLTRSKNSINVAVKNLADFAFSVCGFWAVGFGLMFGASWHSIIGTTDFFLPLDNNAFLVSFFVFQAMFCGTATTIFSGAVAERMRFSSYIIVATLLAFFIYPVFGHLAWGGLNLGKPTGFLNEMGFIDFAGSTVVHSVGGWVALAALLVIGPRRGRFPDNAPPREIIAGNLPLSVLGAFLLWFGWFGFNGGSTLAMNDSVPLIIANTTLAGGAGAVSCLFTGWWLTKLPKVTYLINGSLGGLVAITANCHVVNADHAILIGTIAGPVCLGVEMLLEHRKIDDAVGAVPVHLGCGIWGTIAVALFGDPERIGTGLNFIDQLLVQLLGIFIAFVLSFCIPLILIRIINRFWPMRVTAEEEQVGLNVSEHGARTEALDLFDAMDKQAQSGDLSLRVPVEPFSEVGQIAVRYNQVMNALEAAVAKTEAVVQTATDAIITFGRDNLRILATNPSAKLMFSVPGCELEGISVTELFLPVPGASPETIRSTLFSGEHVEMAGRRGDGTMFPVEAVVTEASVNSDSFFVGTFRDITERKKAAEALETQQAYFRQLFESSPLGIVHTNRKGTIVEVNKGFEELFGHPRNELIGKLNREVVVPRELMPEADSFRQAALNGHTVSRETRRVHRDGSTFPVSVIGYPISVRDTIEGVYYLYEDISQRKAYEEQLSHQAFHDSLTGLPNRVLFMERLNRAIKRAERRKDYAFAALMLDMDQFKWINDSLGHLAGDKFLIEIAHRLESCIRAVDTVARLGGDEFGLLLEEYGSPNEVVLVSKRLQERLQEPIDLDGNDVRTSASIGIVLRTGDYKNAERIMRDADIAMYRAKETGKARFKVFNNKMHRQIVEELKLDSDLRRAVSNNEFRLHYQPIVTLPDLSMKGFEALIRWENPTQGLLQPDQFIPLAEENGLIIPIGQWVIKEACTQMAAWIKNMPEMEDMTMSVNLSGKQFIQSDLALFIEKMLTDAGLPPKNLKIEITETALMKDAKLSVGTLSRLKKLGVQIVIDDFGTGYSSLSYLHRFPIDELKIDRSFLCGPQMSKDNGEIVRTIISMAQNIGVGVVAEGVEDSSQLDYLNSAHCMGAQGFMFSRPIAADQAWSFLQRHFNKNTDETTPQQPKKADIPTE